MAYKVMFISLGCAKNLVDSEKMLETLSGYGFEFTENPADADAAVVNTCTFIDEAKAESIEHILETASFKKPENGRLKALVVAGCMVERYKETLYDEIPEIDAIVGLASLQDIASVILWALDGNKKIRLEDIPMVRMNRPKNKIGGYSGGNGELSAPRVSLTPPFWSYLKVADGCDNPCSFCVIPQIRGRFKSVPVDIAAARAKRLAMDGVKEINIIAQDSGNYGRDIYGRPRLHELIDKISQIDGIKWIRILYTYPLHLNDALIKVIASNPKVCKYIDVPLQHVSDGLLKLMKRGMTYDKTAAFIEKLRGAIPGVIIRTSFIIGHPGETEDDVDRLIEFLDMYKIEKAGFFRYSQEDGTVSAGYAGQVSEKVKIRRLKKVSLAYDKVLKSVNRSMIGKELEFMIEDFDEQSGLLMARSYREAPEVDGYVHIAAESAKYFVPGTFINAKIIKAKKFELYAEAV
ncbi:MAG TPA: 30S ribosomal protein S12 methylthiotransferase RimO [Candidatus Wallbacteria bacterium]|nr:30S ribosomal protein S12 methylthiotransferase RimO [Candidatus Wallbacteria bacterium]